jgi:uncharacterized SAM-binding protein YcdF (DUF218 family)
VVVAGIALARPAASAIARLPVDLLVAVEEPPALADAVAIHGGGTADAYREQLAVRLWREGRVDRIVPMGGTLPFGDPMVTYARAVEARLRQLGAPPEAIQRSDEGTSTAEEVVALRRLAEREGWRHVVLTSHRWHTRRIAILAEQAFAGSPVAWTVSGPSELGFDPDGWWQQRASRDVVLGEWLRIALALLFPV